MKSLPPNLGFYFLLEKSENQIPHRHNHQEQHRQGQLFPEEGCVLLASLPHFTQLGDLTALCRPRLPFSTPLLLNLHGLLYILSASNSIRSLWLSLQSKCYDCRSLWPALTFDWASDHIFSSVIRKVHLYDNPKKPTAPDKGMVLTLLLSSHRFLPNQNLIRINLVGVPVMAQRKQIWLGSMRTQVWSLALLRGLRIQCCHELWCRSQMQLGSGVALAVV